MFIGIILLVCFLFLFDIILSRYILNNYLLLLSQKELYINCLPLGSYFVYVALFLDNSL